MSYTTRKEAMGDSVSDLLKCGKSVIGGAVDPYLPEVFCRVSQLQALTTDRTMLQAMFGKKPTSPVTPCVSTPFGQKGVGVERVIRPLRGLVYVEQHPAAVWAGIAVLFGVPMLVGYMIGRKTR
jgi:hypothetical protein